MPDTIVLRMKAGVTSQRIPVHLQAASGGGDSPIIAAAYITATYRTPGAAETTIPLVDKVVTDAWTSGGWIPDRKGYELCVPNAALAAAGWCRVTAQATDLSTREFVAYIVLDANDVGDCYAKLTDTATGLARDVIYDVTATSSSSAGTIVFPSSVPAVDDELPPGTRVIVIPVSGKKREAFIKRYLASRTATTEDPTFAGIVANDRLLVEAAPAPVASLTSVDSVVNPVAVDTTSITAIATKVWTIDFSAIGSAIDAVRRSPGNAIRMLLNKLGIIGTTLTVYKEDDNTVAYTATVTPAPGASPISGTDPN